MIAGFFLLNNRKFIHSILGKCPNYKEIRENRDIRLVKIPLSSIQCIKPKES
jgi:hypothetical protein